MITIANPPPLKEVLSDGSYGAPPGVTKLGEEDKGGVAAGAGGVPLAVEGGVRDTGGDGGGVPDDLGGVDGTGGAGGVEEFGEGVKLPLLVIADRCSRPTIVVGTDGEGVGVGCRPAGTMERPCWPRPVMVCQRPGGRAGLGSGSGGCGTWIISSGRAKSPGSSLINIASAIPTITLIHCLPPLSVNTIHACSDKRLTSQLLTHFI